MSKVVIAKNIVVEPFVTDDETKVLFKKIFAGIGLMIITAIVSFLFYWSYNKNIYLFNLIMSIVLLAYCFEIGTITYMIRDKINTQQFYLLIGSTMTFGFIAICLIIINIIKIFTSNSSSSSRMDPRY